MLKRSSRNKKNSDSIQLMINITSICVLFGLTWIFGALTVVKADQTFQIMFALINSLQGFLIFIFFCAMNKDIRLELFQLLVSCHKKCSPSSQAHETTLRQAETDETAFTEVIKVLGPTAGFTRTLTRHKRHMVEVVTVTFDEGGNGSGLNLCEVAKL